MSGVTWRFDPAPPSNVKQGGNPVEKALQGHNAVFEREVLQNAGDQLPKNAVHPVEVRISIIELTGESKDTFLEAFGWGALRPHVVASATGHSTFEKKLSKAVHRIGSDRPLRLVRVEDFGANGLLGGEDEPTQNFCLLCKADFVTSSNANRMGSFGLGKGVLWRSSGISTVLFSSAIPKDKGGKNHLRIFGRSILTSHPLQGGKAYAANGFFGLGEKVPQYQEHRSVSIWDDNSLASKLRLARPLEQGREGATAIVVDFIDPTLDEQPTAEKLLEQLNEHVCEWFWPGLVPIAGRTALKVELTYIKNDEQIMTMVCDPVSKWGPFIEAATLAPNQTELQNPGDVVVDDVEIEFPSLVDEPPQPKYKSNIRVVVRAEGANYKNHPRRECVALLRRNLMVVSYEKLRAESAEELPCFPVALAGLANGNSVSDQRLHDFLRSSEPPTHDTWKYTDDVALSYHRGGAAAQKQVYKGILDSAARIIKGKPNTDGKEIPALARYFQFGGAGDGVQTRQLRISIKENVRNLAAETWRLRGVVLNREAQKKIIPEWNATLSFLVKGAGPESVVVAKAQTFTAGATATIENNGVVISVEDDESAEFEVEVALNNTIFRKHDFEFLVLEVRI